ncbi:hypothetical protein ARMGADRAFT_1028358 [Armillaria gallica]|uniref:Uncharacterized protein n=1 Tax=Armillaria gallica TaxID=47427 RepID=A0A2H3E933_ARMGA|nr:hypothetical protein ARMGADRAFT_1028358 [Armillaria gallica]
METHLHTFCWHHKRPKVVFERLDRDLNDIFLQALWHGLYTGIVAITLWTMFSPPKQIRSTFLRTVIITLVFKELLVDSKWGRANYLISHITNGISILLVDATIIWRCWVLWVRRWKIVLLPGFFTIAGTAMVIMQILSESLHNSVKTGFFAAEIDWTFIYLLLTLTTTVMCTFLIRRNLMAANFSETILQYIREIAPTLLTLRVAAIPNSSSGDRESNLSKNISDIDFWTVGENTSSDNPSEQSFSGSHGTHSTEIV